MCKSSNAERRGDMKTIVNQFVISFIIVFVIRSCYGDFDSSPPEVDTVPKNHGCTTIVAAIL